MIIGFTGTQKGMTAAQKREVTGILARICDPLKDHNRFAHHGDCVGADAEFDLIAHSLRWVTIIHPASDVSESKKAHTQEHGWIAKPALIRNHDIVDVSELLIATPGQSTEVQRSGTWATIRYAHKVQKPLIVISPDGTIIRENFNV